MQSSIKDESPSNARRTKRKSKTSPSAWTNSYCCDPPSTPSSNSSCSSVENDDFDMYTDIDVEEMKYDTKHTSHLQPTWPLYNTSFTWNELLPLVPCIEKMNGKTIDMHSNEYTNNKNICIYNEITGGRCYEMEQNGSQIAIQHNKSKTNTFHSYLNHIHKQIFCILNFEFYENILTYLDAKSILNGLMFTCKKWHYFKFIEHNESNIWYKLLMRDFPKLFDDKYFLYIPYMNPGLNSFENDILLSLRNTEKLLYFTKIKYDPFWSLIHFTKFSHNDTNHKDNETIKTIWRDFRWSELFFGKYDKTNGLNAYKELTKLRNHEYFVAFRNVELPDNDMIDYFCNAIRRYMPSGKAVLYLNPYLSSQRIVHWKRNRTNQEILWVNEYRQCWAMPQNEMNPHEINKLPPIIQLIGSTQFQNGKETTPKLTDSDWMQFLQSFNPTIANMAEVPDAWFQKQFMLNEMENRLKNIRVLVDIIRE